MARAYRGAYVGFSTLAVSILRHHIEWLVAEAERRKWQEPLCLFPSAENAPLDYSRMADEPGHPALRR